ncbi:hypothetical protein LTR84_007766 [Exophiala bonariae]|uniref:Globin-sensor domain-containing protein n=1 Tax=Exophiala bonariae TaxID=1690606 RepID=A0AAV9NL43_9EURO|nr:hypothetical protein LTR84_007766 [Exophiala bonariae]
MAQIPVDHVDILADTADDLHIYDEVIDLDRLLRSMNQPANLARSMKRRYLDFFDDKETLSEHGHRLYVEAQKTEMLQTRTRRRFLEYLDAYQNHGYTKEIDRLAHLEGALHCLKLSQTLSAEFATILEHLFTEFGLHEVAGEIRLETARWRRHCLTVT